MNFQIWQWLARFAVLDFLSKFKEASKLAEVEQNSLAKWVLEELKAERKWEQTFAESEDMLARLADEALGEHNLGKTKLLDIDKL